MTDIGQRIAVLREERGLSQKQLSDELAKIGLKVRRETITQWENGTRDLKTEYTIKLADFFGVTCDYILRGIEAGNISIYKETGLTNESINNLKEINAIQLEFGGVCFSNSINVLIGSKRFVNFLLAFFNCQSEIQKLVDCKKRFLDRLDVCEGKIPPKLSINEYAAFLAINKESSMHNEAYRLLEQLDTVDYHIYKLERALKNIIETYQKETEKNG